MVPTRVDQRGDTSRARARGRTSRRRTRVRTRGPRPTSLCSPTGADGDDGAALRVGCLREDAEVSTELGRRPGTLRAAASTDDADDGESSGARAGRHPRGIAALGTHPANRSGVAGSGRLAGDVQQPRRSPHRPAPRRHRRPLPRGHQVRRHRCSGVRHRHGQLQPPAPHPAGGEADSGRHRLGLARHRVRVARQPELDLPPPPQPPRPPRGGALRGHQRGGAGDPGGGRRLLQLRARLRVPHR